MYIFKYYNLGHGMSINAIQDTFINLLYIYLCYLKDKDNEYIITYVSINFQNCSEEYNKKINVDNNSKSEALYLY